MSAPLDGIRVLDLTRLLPGNYCAWLLAALGAEVIKIEDPGAGDYMRTFGVQVDGQGATHHVVNRAKRSVVIDLKSTEGREVFLRLVDTADAVVDSFRPGVMDRLGLSHATLRARRPQLVVASISGFGAEGPRSGDVAHDLNALAFSGYLERLVGSEGGLPAAPTTPIADIVGGSLFPALGIMALIHRASRTGEGGWLDAALVDGVSLLPSVQVCDVLAGAPLPPRGTPEFDGRPFYRVYALLDGMVAVGAVEAPFWRALCEVLGEHDLIEAQWDDQRRDEVTRRLAVRFAGLTKVELAELLDGRDTCTTIVQDYPESFASAHARARNIVRPAPDADLDVLAPPFRIDGARPSETRGAPRQGQHTLEVLAELGLDTAEVGALLDASAVAERGGRS